MQVTRGEKQPHETTKSKRTNVAPNEKLDLNTAPPDDDVDAMGDIQGCQPKDERNGGDVAGPPVRWKGDND